MIRTIGQICVLSLSANLAGSESYCDFLLHADRWQFVALPHGQSCEKGQGQGVGMNTHTIFNQKFYISRENIKDNFLLGLV